MFAMPVAPSGWPFDSRPPETLTGMRPPSAVLTLVDQLARLAVLAQAQVLVVQDLRRGEAVVQLDQADVARPDGPAIS